VSGERACPSCGHTKKLNERGYCSDKAACLRRATASMVTSKYVGGFDPDKAYRDAQKGDAA
jgi:hypothetical protein